MKYTYFEIWLIIGLILALAVVLFTGGCSNNTAKETLTVTKKAIDGSSVSVAYRGEISQWLVAYFTRTKQIEGVSPLSSIVVGSIDSEPDPNSVSAGIEGFIKGIKGF